MQVTNLSEGQGARLRAGATDLSWPAASTSTLAAVHLAAAVSYWL